MTLQTPSLTTALLPPALPTLDLGPATGTYSAAGFTKFAQAATVTGDTTDKILGLQVRIDSGSGTLGVVNGSTLQTSGTFGTKIGYEYLAGTKLLRLTDISGDLSATGADFQAALREVAISGASGNVSISANLGKPVYRAANGHYYEFVSFTPGSTSWTASKADAETRKFLTLTGYLATVTDAAENSFLTATFDSRGWIGAQADSSRKWTWVGGPEAGKSFWLGNTGGTSTGADLPYSNWDPNPAEPNNFGAGESYVQFTTGGFWNDLADSPEASPEPRYNPDGYWVEYSEAPGTNELGGTRDTLALSSAPTTTPLDLVFYDPVKGQVSFAFTADRFDKIGTEGLTGDTPVLTNNTNNSTPVFGSTWRVVNANVDVDRDGVKDIIFASKDTNVVGVFFGALRTGTDRQFSYRNSAFATFNGNVVIPGLSWTIDFASDKIGANNTTGVFWRSDIGQTAIWSLEAVTTNGFTSLNIVNSGIIASIGVNSDWKAVGDGEFNSNVADREIFWTNSRTSQVATWSLTANRTSKTSQLASSGPVDSSSWSVVGIANIRNSGLNDNIIWQEKSGSRVAVWTLVNGVYSSTTGASVINLTAADRIKAIVDVDSDGVLDLVGQFDGNGTIAAYTLTSTYGLKNTTAPRTQYFSNNPAGYRPAKGGLNSSVLELVNVGQYNTVTA